MKTSGDVPYRSYRISIAVFGYLAHCMHSSDVAQHERLFLPSLAEVQFLSDLNSSISIMPTQLYEILVRKNSTCLK